MQKMVKGFYLFLFFSIVTQLSFAFANTGRGDLHYAKNDAVMARSGLAASAVYDSLSLDQEGLSKEAFEFALAGWEKLKQQGKLQNESLLTIADFSQSSSEKRLYVLDMVNCKLLFHTLVAHGRNSGKEFATNFSNKISSNKSSPGFYLTGQTYYGGNGYSLKLLGLEPGINDKAMTRAIVMHGADYVDESYIPKLGYIGRSQGCPAVPVKYARPIINALKGGSCLYIYTADEQYTLRSAMLKDLVHLGS